VSKKKIKKGSRSTRRMEDLYWTGDEVLRNLLESGILSCDEETRKVILTDRGSKVEYE